MGVNDDSWEDMKKSGIMPSKTDSFSVISLPVLLVSALVVLKWLMLE